jgi:hypothetical protein
MECFHLFLRISMVSNISEPAQETFIDRLKRSPQFTPIRSPSPSLSPPEHLLAPVQSLMPSVKRHLFPAPADRSRDSFPERHIRGLRLLMDWSSTDESLIKLNWSASSLVVFQDASLARDWFPRAMELQSIEQTRGRSTRCSLCCSLGRHSSLVANGAD